MTHENLYYLFFSMLILASMPTISSILVFSRSAQFGLKHGLATIIGIVMVDTIFILISLLSLSFLTQFQPKIFGLFNLLAAGYLIYLARQIWCSTSSNQQSNSTDKSTYFSSVLAGFLITIGDQKALLFYFAFMPVFINEEGITTAQIGLLILSASSALILAKLPYAYAALKLTAKLSQLTLLVWLKKLAAILIFISAFILIWRALS